MTCVGCSGYYDSLQMLQNSQASTDSLLLAGGCCVHTRSMDTIMRVVLAHEPFAPTTAFDYFVQKEMSSPIMTLQVRQWNNTSRYLVVVSQQQAFKEDTTRHTTCTFRKFGSDYVVNCENVRCRRGKHKNLKNIVQEGDVCCHLRQILASTTEFSNPTHSLHLNSDDEDPFVDGTCAVNLVKYTASFMFKSTFSLKIATTTRRVTVRLEKQIQTALMVCTSVTMTTAGNLSSTARKRVCLRTFQLLHQFLCYSDKHAPMS